MADFVDPLPTGTVSVFCQAAAPLPGWEKVTTYNDYTLRVVNGSGGSVGGSVAMSTLFTTITMPATVSATVPTSTATALTAPQLPVHNHGPSWSPDGSIQPSGPQASVYYFLGPITAGAWPGNTFTGPGTAGPISPTSSGHSHGAAPGTGPATCSLDFRVKYVDMILCRKT